MMTTNGDVLNPRLSAASDGNSESLAPLGAFLIAFATRLLGAGATCARVRKNVARIAAAFDVHVELLILPVHVTIMMWSNDRMSRFHATEAVQSVPVSFYENTRLSALSWKIYDKHLSLDVAEKEYGLIISGYRFNRSLLVLLVTLANASFCRLFGGDVASMIIVAFATAVGFTLKLVLASFHVDLRLALVACAFISSVIGCGGYVFGWGDTPDIALGTSVLYLIPGICYINGACDLMDGHYLCSFSRLMHGVILTVCITIGLSLGFLLMNINLF